VRGSRGGSAWAAPARLGGGAGDRTLPFVPPAWWAAPGFGTLVAALAPREPPTADKELP